MTVIAASLTLTACMQGESYPPVLDEKAGADDVLPDMISPDAKIDPDSARFAGESNGAQVFVTRNDKGRDVCLVGVKGEAWATACSLTGSSFELNVQGEIFSFDPAKECEDMTELTPGVCAA